MCPSRRISMIDAMTTHAPQRPSRSTRWGIVALVIVPSVVVSATMLMLYLVVLPLFPAVHQYYFPESTATYATYRVAILGHIVFASIALVVGPLNLYNGLRRRHRRVHSRVGAVYAIAVSVAGTCALFMSFHAYAGTLPGGRFLITSGLFTLGCVWVGTLGLAVRAIAVQRDVDRHAFWMIVNVSATYSAVLFRLLNLAIVSMGRFELLYPLLGWLGWVPSVAIGVLLARHRSRLQAARRGRPRRTPTPLHTAPFPGDARVATTSLQVPGEEPSRAVHLEPRCTAVPTQVGVQRLLLGAERVEQIQDRLPFHPFVVPLHEELQRNGDLPGLLAQGVGHEGLGEEGGGRDSRLDHRQPDADGDHAVVTHRAVDLGQREERVQGGPPFRDRSLDQRDDEVGDDLVDRLAGL
jgi:hypothetical protein